jgi:hypothetical protein
MVAGVGTFCRSTTHTSRLQKEAQGRCQRKSQGEIEASELGEEGGTIIGGIRHNSGELHEPHG